MSRLALWQGREQGSVLEFSIGPKELLVVFLYGAGVRQAVGSQLSEEALIQLSQNPGLRTEWLGVAQRAAGDRFVEYRLIGGQEQVEYGRQLLADGGIPEGSHVNSAAAIRFAVQLVPAEGRLRVQKGIAGSARKTRVLIADDSETIRNLLTKILSSDPEIECVGAVELPSKVEEAIQRLKPDVLTLDIHMPEMDGVTLLKQLYPKYGIPTLMISSVSKEDGTYVLDALEAGAFDYIQKPALSELKIAAPAICEKVKAAHVSTAKPLRRGSRSSDRPAAAVSASGVDFSHLIAIGSSTGGTEALKCVFTSLPKQIPPILVVQHIPPIFSRAFADRMNQLCPFEVKEAEHGDLVAEGRVLIAPGGKQMRVVGRAGSLRISIEDTPTVNRHKPSVDVLFDSIAEAGVPKVVAAVLTGMGNDGARGLLKLRQSGARTLAQDEETSVVYGMPREAFRLGGAEKVVPLPEVAATLFSFCRLRGRGAA